MKRPLLAVSTVSLLLLAPLTMSQPPKAISQTLEAADQALMCVAIVGLSNGPEAPEAKQLLETYVQLSKKSRSDAINDVNARLELLTNSYASGKVSAETLGDGAQACGRIYKVNIVANPTKAIADRLEPFVEVDDSDYTEFDTCMGYIAIANGVDSKEANAMVDTYVYQTKRSRATGMIRKRHVYEDVGDQLKSGGVKPDKALEVARYCIKKYSAGYLSNQAEDNILLASGRAPVPYCVRFYDRATKYINEAGAYAESHTAAMPHQEIIAYEQYCHGLKSLAQDARQHNCNADMGDGRNASQAIDQLASNMHARAKAVADAEYEYDNNIRSHLSCY